MEEEIKDSEQDAGIQEDPLSGSEEKPKHVTDGGYLEADAEMYQDYLDKVMVADMEDVLLHEEESDRSGSDRDPGQTWSQYKSLRQLSAHASSLEDSDAESEQGFAWENRENGSSGNGSSSHMEDPTRVVEAEVVASRLVNGEVSLGDRLVGVKSHAEYNVRVTSADGRVWMVQRRYREFMDLHWELVRFLEKLHQRESLRPGTVLLPAEWSEAWKEGGQVVGTSSTKTIERRRELLHSCMAATVAAGPPLSSSPAFVRFLAEETMVMNPKTGMLVRLKQTKQQSTFDSALGSFSQFLRTPTAGAQQHVSTLASRLWQSGSSCQEIAALELKEEVKEVSNRSNGEASAANGTHLRAGSNSNSFHHQQPVRLILNLHPLVLGDHRHISSQLVSQRYACASCSRPLEDTPQGQGAAKGLPLGLSASFAALSDSAQGTGVPRLCHYMRRLFCGACHSGETAVLPSLVLHKWDFTEKPVCQQAKAYLDSIHEQPILSVAAVNPMLFQKVHSLGHLNTLRTQVAAVYRALAPNCLARDKVRHMLGRREYVLHPGTDGFYAMKELEDISKGTFALFPDLLRKLAVKLYKHLESSQCRACTGAGVAVCAAGSQCAGGASGIIANIKESTCSRCPLCEAAYHARCFKKLKRCGRCKGNVNKEAGEELVNGDSLDHTSPSLRSLNSGSSSNSDNSANKGWFGWGKRSNTLQMEPLFGQNQES